MKIIISSIMLIIILMFGSSVIVGQDNIVRVDNMVKVKTKQTVVMEMDVNDGSKDSYKKNVETNIYYLTRENKYKQPEYYTGYLFEYVYYICIDKNNKGVLLTWSNEQKFYFYNGVEMNIEEHDGYFLCNFKENGVAVRVKIKKYI